MTGGCLCGALQFRIAGSLLSPHVCSCAHCQRWAGGPAVSWADVSVTDFEWIGGGQPSWYRTYPDSSRGFCPVCGSSVCVVDDGAELMGVTLASLDGQDVEPDELTFAHDAPVWFRRAFETWVESGRDSGSKSGSRD